MALKNLWSLTIDEALVAEELKKHFNKKDFEVFFPVNSQLKDIDLALLNLKTGKSKTVQVKGSRTYEPKRLETLKFGAGSPAWFIIDKDAIFNASNKLDFFIFVLHNMIDEGSKKEIKVNYLVIPLKDLQRLVKKKKQRKNGTYHFSMWVDNKGKRAFDFNLLKTPIQFSKYLDNWNLLK